MTAVGLSVFLIYMVQVLINVPIKTIRRELATPYRYASGFAAKSTPIGAELVNILEHSGAVKQVYPCMYSYTNISPVIGGTTGTQVISFTEKDMASAIQSFGLSLSEGRLPNPGKNEIALHELAARNKSLRVGSMIGSNVQEGEVLEGSYTVCGILSGEAILSVTSLEYELTRRNIDNAYSLGVLVIPKAGQLEKMNADLDALNGSGLVKRTFATTARQFEEDTRSVLALVTMIGLMTIVILGIYAGFLNYIHFYVRRSEFATLFALGFTRGQVIRQAFMQIAAINLAGFAAGWLLSLLAAAALNLLLFAAKGLALPAMDGEAILKSCCAPLFATLSGVVPVWRILLALDVTDVLEGQG
jgi:ABC-type lipoprotein release transport system permease subunit